MLSAGVAAISLLLLSRGLFLFRSLAVLMTQLRRSVSLFGCFTKISMLAIPWHSLGGEGRLKRKKKKKREDLAFLFTQVVLVKLHPDLLLQVSFLFGEQGVLDFKVFMAVPSSREAISDEITSSTMAEC